MWHKLYRIGHVNFVESLEDAAKIHVFIFSSKYADRSSVDPALTSFSSSQLLFCVDYSLIHLQQRPSSSSSSKKMVNFLPSLVLLTGISSLGVVQGQFTATILHMNDHHSNLEGHDFEVENSAIGPDSNLTEEELTVQYGGFPRVVTLFDALSQSETNVIKLHAGDAMTGTKFYSLFGPEPDSRVMKTVCFDAMALGNHEFDDGDANLADFITMLRNSTTCPDTPVLAANVVPGESSPLRALQETGALASSTILTIGTEKVGIVGIDIKDKTELSSNPDEGTTLLDEVETATSAVADLTSQGVNKVVLLTHIGYDNDLEWMVDVPGVDVVVGGDSHTLLGDSGTVDPIFTASGAFPTVATRASDGKTVCVVQAWEYAKLVGILSVTWDDQGDVTACSGHPVIPFEAAEPTVQSYLENLGPSFISTEGNAAAQTIVDEYLALSDSKTKEVIATVPEDICFERIPGQGRSTICDASESAEQGGAVCNLVAQAFLDQEASADVAIQNGGGCRTDIPAGNFTFGDAIALLPFSNTLVTLSLTGADIKLVLEQALENALLGSSTGSYPYASGLRYAVDANQELGNRISNLEVNPRLAGDWGSIDESASYTVVTNSFVAAGRDGYFLFGEIEDDLVIDTYKEYSQTFIEYAVQEGVLTSPPKEDFSTVSFIPLADNNDIVPTSSPVEQSSAAAPTGSPVEELSSATLTDSPVEQPSSAAPTGSPVEQPSSAVPGSVSLFVTFLVGSTTMIFINL